MLFDFDLAPFGAQLPRLVNQESASLNAHEFAPVETLFLDDIKISAQLFVRIGQKIELKSEFGPEFLVGCQAISGYAQYDSILPPEFGVQITKVLAL